MITGQFIERLYLIDVDQTVSKIFRVLEVGRRFLLTTRNAEDIKRKIRRHTALRRAQVFQDFLDALKLRLRTIGFSKIKVFGSGMVIRYLGYRFPFLSLCDGYLAMGDNS